MSTNTRKRSVFVASFVLFLSLLTPLAASAQPSCADFKFFGVHGTNETGTIDDRGNYVIDEKYMGVGEKVWNVWNEVKGNNLRSRVPGSLVFEAIVFPETTVEFPSAAEAALLLARLAGNDLRAQLEILEPLYQISKIEDGANTAATALVDQLYDTYLNCSDETRYLIVGYSQGAWAIDKALRLILAPASRYTGMANQIAGVLLMGDPAWPVSDRWPGRQGIATTFGRGVTDPYYPEPLTGRIVSHCASYPDREAYDPTCLFDRNPVHFVQHLYVHAEYVEKRAEIAESLVSLLE